eukprot:g12359.t1
MDVEPLDEKQARQRLLEGGYFVALGVPPGVEFGIDLKSYTTGPQFKGVKMIPPGLHLAHFGTGEGEKQGIFFRSSAGSVAATQWDASAEDLVDAQTCLPEGALRALRDSVLRLEMDTSLGPHPFDQLAAWLNLTNCITDSVLERCGVPVGAKVLAGSSSAETGEAGAEPSNADGDVHGVGDGGAAKGKKGKGRRGTATATVGSGKELVPHFPHIGRVARYCEVPGPPLAGADYANGSGSTNAAPEEVTKQHMDGSESLRRCIAADFGGSWMEMLGELQLSFVMFVSLSSLKGFRHWQALSALLCRCGDALKTDPALFTAFTRMLHAHLKLVPEDFFDVELSKDNFLVPCLSALLQNVLPDESLAPALLDAAKRLLKFLQQRFGLFASGRGAKHGPAQAVAAEAVGGDVMADGDDDSQDIDAHANGGCRRDDADEPLSVTGGLSLMQLELSEEDQPAVVPYEEVVRALGDGALGLNGVMPSPQQEVSSSEPRSDKRAQKTRSSVVAPSSQVIDAHQTTTEWPMTSGPVQGQGQTQANGPGAATGNGDGDGAGRVLNRGVNGCGVVSTPSSEHSRRWKDIDRLLVAAAPASNGTNTTPSVPSTEASGGMSQGSTASPSSGIGGSRCNSAMSSSSAAAPAASTAVAAVAKRYPLLFAATRKNEDVMMAAARLVASDEEERGGRSSDARVVREAIAFLEEEVAASEDGGASVWQVSGAPRGGD